MVGNFENSTCFLWRAGAWFLRGDPLYTVTQRLNFIYLFEMHIDPSIREGDSFS